MFTHQPVTEYIDEKHDLGKEEFKDRIKATGQRVRLSFGGNNSKVVPTSSREDVYMLNIDHFFRIRKSREILIGR